MTRLWKDDPLANCMYERERLRRRKRAIDLCIVGAPAILSLVFMCALYTLDAWRGVK